jgi:hypothetical protein
MSILVDQLPTAFEIDGTEYAIDVDFRTCINIIMAFEDPELTNIEKQLVMLENLYQDQPENTAEAIRMAVKFLNGGSEEKESESVYSPRVYSFTKDAQYIFSAFLQTHGIDLQTVDMHWWKFLALFMDLGSDTTFSNIVSLRKKIKTGKATKEEKEAAREIGHILDLPEDDDRSIDEKEAELEFLRLVEEGKKK